MTRVPVGRRRLLSWLPSILLLLLIAGFAVAAVGVNTSWWVDPDPTAAVDQTAPNGSSVFTDAGVDYLMRTGEVRIRMDADALSADELGLPAGGTRSIPYRGRPLVVLVSGTAGAMAVDRVSELVLGTENGALVSVAATREMPGGFLEAHAMLRDVQELYGWSADEVAAVPDRFAEAQRQNPDAPTAVTVGPGTAVGLSVSATVAGSGGNALIFTARPAG
jgi:hypothetical protein